MKMEILAVQNEFMHVMPSKAKDGSTALRWTSPAPSSSPPPSPPSPVVSQLATAKRAVKTEVTKSPKRQNHHHHHHHSNNQYYSNQRIIQEEEIDGDFVKAAEEEQEDSFLRTLPHWNESEIEHVRNVLMATLRDAKQRHLACTEVLLPCDMLERIAIDMLTASDEEACGIRGANICIDFESDSESERREIARCNTDLNTVATFELRLTLKQEHGRGKWISAIMPQFIRNLTRGSTVIISRDYELVKHKLSYSFAE